MMIFVFLLTIVIVLVICIILLKNKKIRRLRQEYEASLKGKDKGLALKKGYEYYAALRGYHQITALDELELMKDIDSMM